MQPSSLSSIRRRLPLLALSAVLALGAGACAKKPDAPEQSAAAQEPAKPGKSTARAPLLPTLDSVLKIAIDQAMPAWELETLDGKLVKSADLRGKIVVLDIWATWCTPCVYEVPGYNDLSRKYADQGLVVVGASVDRGGPAIVQRFVDRYKVTYPIGIAGFDLLDSLIKDDGIPLPLTLLIDREGILRHAKIGPMETADYEKLVQARL